MALWLASIPTEAAPVVAVGTAVAAVIGFSGLLVRLLVSQQGGWKVLLIAAQERATASDARVAALEVEVEALTASKRACETLVETHKRIAEAAEARAQTAEERATMFSLRLSEYTRPPP